MMSKQITIEEFYEDLNQEIISESRSRELVRSEAFFENICEELIETGELSPDYEFAFYQSKGVEICGYSYYEDRKILSLMVSSYFQDDEFEKTKIDQSQITTKFKRLKKFLDIILTGTIDSIEDNDVYDMAFNIRERIEQGLVDKFRFYLITNGVNTGTKKTIDNLEVSIENQKIDIEHRVIDLSYIYENHVGGNAGKKIEIQSQMPYLEIDSSNEEYSSYLSVMTGKQIVEMYEEYGQQLLEQNVRTFLMFRAKVNKGLRETIKSSPERFFAYNNGITGTASDIEIHDGKITSLKGFQIVNGGQTTSSIYACYKKDKLDVSGINVQLKLSVIKNKEHHSDFVSRVARYANTQNAIKDADFFSNSPFHQQFKDWSKIVKAPIIGGDQFRTKWYYERVRGEFQNDQAYLTKAQKNSFQREYPYKIDKTFISKPEVSWLQRPDVVSKGVSYSFDLFATKKKKKKKKSDLAITEDYYKHVIARVIMFRSLEKLISSSDWYDGGFRAQTVTYSMAYLSYIIQKSNKHFDFNKIWELQALPKDVVQIFETITRDVYLNITNPASGSANIAQWAKSQKCWESVKNDLDVNIDENASFIISKTIIATQKKQQNADNKFVGSVQKWKFVLEKANSGIWSPLLAHYAEDLDYSPKKLDILTKFASGLLPSPSEKQAEIIYDIYEQAIDIGWIQPK